MIIYTNIFTKIGRLKVEIVHIFCDNRGRDTDSWQSPKITVQGENTVITVIVNFVIYIHP